MTKDVQVLLQRGACGIFDSPASVRDTYSDALAFLERMIRCFRTSLIWAVLLPLSLDLQASAMPILRPLNGYNLSLVAAEKLSPGRMQLPSEQFSGPELPTAPPMLGIDAMFFFQSAVTSLGKLDYNKAVIEFTEAIRLHRHFAAASVAGTPLVIKETLMRLFGITVRLFVSNQGMPLPTTIVERFINAKAN
jgi:hypothetical protein